MEVCSKWDLRDWIASLGLGKTWNLEDHDVLGQSGIRLPQGCIELCPIEDIDLDPVLLLSDAASKEYAQVADDAPGLSLLGFKFRERRARPVPHLYGVRPRLALDIRSDRLLAATGE